jgi:hypothetical protein
MVANQIFSLHRVDFILLWVGVLAFGIQIYADFSAYSDIARGTAKLLGVELTRNFRHPYFSASPAEFWRRWHITLGRWFKSFVYEPLKGANASRLRTCMCYMTVFALSGLWHGASWNFLLWGVVHGVALVICFLAKPYMPRFWLESAWTLPLRVAATFALVTFGWLFFREHDIAQIGRYLALNPFGPRIADPGVAQYFLTLVLLSSLPLVLAAWLERYRESFHLLLPGLARGRTVLALAFSLVLVVLLVLLAAADPTNFIYFQF